MFTGIIEEIGKVVSLGKKGDNLNVGIRAKKVIRGLSADNSIAVNGVCLTVVRRRGDTFFVNIVHETLQKSNLGQLYKGSRVNLERSVRLNDRLGGHLVQGHVDCSGKIDHINQLNGSWEFEVAIPKNKRKYIIPVGSVAIDGVSLTVAKINKNSITIAIIPYTFLHTLFGSYKKGNSVNIEFDVIGKYVESFLTLKKNE